MSPLRTAEFLDRDWFAWGQRIGRPLAPGAHAEQARALSIEYPDPRAMLEACVARGLLGAEFLDRTQRCAIVLDLSRRSAGHARCG